MAQMEVRFNCAPFFYLERAPRHSTFAARGTMLVEYSEHVIASVLEEFAAGGANGDRLL